MISLLFFIIGLFLGSFLNVIVDRLPRGESLVYGRSHCDNCHHVLQWYDLFPVASFVITAGKCRYCSRSLSFFYPFSELLTGIILAFIPIAIPYSITTYLFYTFIFCVLIVVFLSDLKYGIIPFTSLLPTILLTIIWLFLIYLPEGNYQLLLVHIVSALCASGFFLFLHIITKGRGMGFGDVVFVFFMGLLLGFPAVIFALYIAFLTGAVISTTLIIMRKKKFKGSTIPFGPFLVLGTYILILWESEILNFFNRYIPMS